MRYKLQPLALRPLFDDIAQIDGHLAQVARRALDVHAPGLDLRQIEHVVDEIEEMRPTCADRIEGITLIAAEGAIALQQLRVADDAIERRPQLVAHVREELALGARRGFGRLLGHPQLVFVTQALGDIPHEGAEEVSASGAHRVGHRDFDRKLVPGAMKAAQLQPAVDDRRLARFVEVAQAFDVRRAEAGRNDRVRQLLADDLVARPAERRRRLRVPADDPAVGVHSDERVVRGIEHQPRPCLALGQILHRLPAIGVGKSDDNEVGEGQRKVLLVELPRTRPADMLDAHHAQRPVLLAERHVEHGADSMRCQIGLAELVRPRIGMRIGRRDDTVVTDGVEIGRNIALVQPLARRVLARDALKKVVTAQRGAILLEAPRADARDFERPRTGLENQSQPIADRDRRASLPRRELGQRLALRRQPALALAQLTL